MDTNHAVFSLGHVLLKVRVSPEAVAAELQSRDAPVNEQVILHKVAKFWNQKRRFDRPDGLLVVTTHRLAFLTKVRTVATTTEFLSFPYADIKHLETTRVMRISPAVRFQVGEDPYVFTLFSGADQVMAAARKASAETAAG